VKIDPPGLRSFNLAKSLATPLKRFAADKHFDSVRPCGGRYSVRISVLLFDAWADIAVAVGIDFFRARAQLASNTPLAFSGTIQKGTYRLVAARSQDLSPGLTKGDIAILDTWSW